MEIFEAVKQIKAVKLTSGRSVISRQTGRA
jgi:hypothetical protein